MCQEGEGVPLKTVTLFIGHHEISTYLFLLNDLRAILWGEITTVIYGCNLKLPPAVREKVSGRHTEPNWLFLCFSANFFLSYGHEFVLWYQCSLANKW